MSARIACDTAVSVPQHDTHRWENQGGPEGRLRDLRDLTSHRAIGRRLVSMMLARPVVRLRQARR